MKKLWSMVLVVALICMTALAGCSGNTDSGVEVGSNGELKIFNWGEYISDGTDGSLDLIKEFEQTTGIKVTAYDTFDSNEQMYAKLKSGTVDSVSYTHLDVYKRQTSRSTAYKAFTNI